MHSRNQQKLKFKRKVKISSLQAAICNVALFKSMKDKQFRDTIFITYCDEGVILEAINETEWKRANDYILGFLTNKKISMLTYGYDKDDYQNLIAKGLKEITRRIKQRDEQCPYINIIHYQKLRKSCQFMDKQKYVQPLKDWQNKNKRNPNFAFLIVEPANKFDQVKKGLLQFLTGQAVPLSHKYMNPIQFLYLFYFSATKDKIRDAFIHKLIQVNPVDQQPNQNNLSKQQLFDFSHGIMIRITNFTALDINEYSYTIIPSNKNINKSGLQFLTEQQLINESKNAKSYNKLNIQQLLIKYLSAVKQRQYSQKRSQHESMQQNADAQQLIIIPYRKQQQQKYRSVIKKYLALNISLSYQQMLRKLQTNITCQISDIQIIDTMYENEYYKTNKVCINSCPFMTIEYKGQDIELDSFLLYLQQLKYYYCTYMVRFYGISVQYKYKTVNKQEIKQKATNNKNQNKMPVFTNNFKKELEKVILVFDYHRNTLFDMLTNDMILDNMQIATIILQLLYYANFLHTHQQPRCLGPIGLSEIFWPMAVILPYLGIYSDCHSFSIEADIKNIGEILKDLLDDEQDQDLDSLLQEMINPSKQQVISINKCITNLQDILNN